MVPANSLERYWAGNGANRGHDNLERVKTSPSDEETCPCRARLLPIGIQIQRQAVGMPNGALLASHGAIE